MDEKDLLFQSLINETVNGIYISDIVTHELLYMNEAALNNFDIEDTDYNGKLCYEFLVRRKSPCPFCKVDKMDCANFVSRNFISPVSNKTFKLKGKLLNWNGRKVHVEYIMDIAKEIDAQKILAEKKAVLKEVMRQTNVSVWEYNVEKKEITQRENSQRIHGYGHVIKDVPESLIKKGYVHPKFVNDYRSLFQKLDKGIGRIEMDALIKYEGAKDYVWERVVYFPIEETNNKVIKYIGTSTNITDQKILQQNYDEFQLFFPKIRNGIIFNVTQNTIDFLKMELEFITKLSNGNMSDFFTKSRLRIPDNEMRVRYDSIFSRDCLLKAYARGNIN